MVVTRDLSQWADTIGVLQKQCSGYSDVATSVLTLAPETLTAWQVVAASAFPGLFDVPAMRDRPQARRSVA
jgi:hypothetical protein